jgi:hypothetical protein
MHRSHNTKLPKSSDTICTFDYDHTPYPITPSAQSNYTSALKSKGVHVHVLLRKNDKPLSPVRHKGTFVGYATDSRCYLVHYDETKRV